MNRIVDYQNLSSQISNWILKYSIDNKINTLVVGVSGGIDSAVVSTLCAETGLPTIVVGLPLNSKKKNTDLSNSHISFLETKYKNVRALDINLSKVFDVFSNIPEFKNEFNSELAFANTKSRIRMISLYQIASSKNGIVVGTGNKVEDFGVGFFTKYGDGGVDISPIADLYKTEVKELGKHLGICQNILDAQPTDGLWDDDRNDEQQLGSTYEEFEWVMEYSDLKDVFTEKETKLIENYQSFNKKNKHKMVPIPIFNLVNNNII